MASTAPIAFQGTIDINRFADQVGSLVKYVADTVPDQQVGIFEICNQSGWQLTFQGHVLLQGHPTQVVGEPALAQIDHGSASTAGYRVFQASNSGLGGVILGYFFCNGGHAPYVMFGVCVRSVGDQLVSVMTSGIDWYARFHGNEAVAADALQIPGVEPAGLAAGEWDTARGTANATSRHGGAELLVKGQIGKVAGSGNRNVFNAKFTLTQP